MTIFRGRVKNSGMGVQEFRAALERLIEQARGNVPPFQIEHALEDAATVLRDSFPRTTGSAAWSLRACDPGTIQVC
jgi:hypothetical protein